MLSSNDFLTLCSTQEYHQYIYKFITSGLTFDSIANGVY